MRPLNGIVVLDFSQYLSGPSSALRLADLGARVIKIENPKTGDNSRRLYVKSMVYDGDGVNFQAINREKESFAANLKDPDDLKMVKRLIAQADVLIENFRPGVMKKLGLDYESVKAINPRLVYATITGYGSEGPWVKKPGQDLLVQSLSGLVYMNGNGDQPPTPFAISIADSFTGTHAAEGIMACLIRRNKTGLGGHVEVSLLESVLYLQLEGLTTYLNDGHKLPVRSRISNAHPDVPAPYGIYPTKDSFIAISMGSVLDLGRILSCEALLSYTDEEKWFAQRDEIKQILTDHLKTKTTAEWLEILRAAKYWSSEVLNWKQLKESEAFRVLDFVQDIRRPGLPALYTTRCPIRFNGQILKTRKHAPRLGEDTQKVIADFMLRESGAEE